MGAMARIRARRHADALPDAGRRRLLTLGGAAVAGLGIAGLDATRAERVAAATLPRLTPGPAASNAIRYVSTAGADTNDGLSWTAPKATVQAALATLPANGGVIEIGAGTFTASGTIRIGSCVHLIGRGQDLTTLTIANNVNADVVQSATFPTDTGSASAPGVGQFSIRDLTIDGNGVNQASGSGMRVFGYDYLIENVRVRNCKDDGIYSEWNYSFPPPNNEPAMLLNVRSHDNGRDGIRWFGPNDSKWDSVDAVNNHHWGVYVWGNGAGLIAANCHLFGNNQQWCWVLDAATMIVGGQAEGAAVGQVWVRANDCQVEPNGIYNAGENHNACAVQLGPAGGTGSSPVQFTRVVTTIGGAYAGSKALVLAAEDQSFIRCLTGLTQNDFCDGPYSGFSTYLFSSGTDSIARTQFAGKGVFVSFAHHHAPNIGNPPTIATGSALGGGGNAALAAASDMGGLNQLRSGSSPSSAGGDVARLAFGSTWGSTGPIVVLTAQNSAAAAIPVYVSATPDGFTLSSATTLAGATDYWWYYQVLGTGLP